MIRFPHEFIVDLSFTSILKKKREKAGFEVGGIFGLIDFVADTWAIVNTFQSRAITEKKLYGSSLFCLLAVIFFSGVAAGWLKFR